MMREKKGGGMRGMGRIFERKGTSCLWIAYRRRGKEIRESSGSSDPKAAERLLKQRLKEVGAESLGLKPFVGPAQDKVSVGALFDDLVSDFEIRGKKTPDFLYRVKPLREYFDFMRAVDTSESVIDRYITDCLAEGQNPATINRRIKLLAQAFNLAVERKRLAIAPKVRLIPGADKKRTGFFERPDFEAVVRNLPADLQDFTRFAYLTGWRKGEIASLLWEDVDLQGRIIRLRGENAKNGEARKVALEGEMWEIIQRRASFREIISETGVRSIPLVFHRDGEPVKSIRKAWATACKLAGIPEKKIIEKDGKSKMLPGKLFHDLRRTAVRNMVRAGIPESIAMKISGHKTRSVFNRYDITSEADLRSAALKAESYIKSLPEKRTEGGQS